MDVRHNGHRDLVVLTIRDDALCALSDPARRTALQGAWALPAASSVRTRPGEATARELAEETAVSAYVEQLARTGRLRRDPRRARGTVGLPGAGPGPSDAAAGPTQPTRAGYPSTSLRSARLAFDHHQICWTAWSGRGPARVHPARNRLLRGGIHRRRAAPRLRDRLGHHARPRNFHRKVTGTAGLLERPAAQRPATGTPAQLYRRGGNRTAVSATLRDGATGEHPASMRGALQWSTPYRLRVKQV